MKGNIKVVACVYGKQRWYERIGGNEVNVVQKEPLIVRYVGSYKQGLQTSSSVGPVDEADFILRKEEGDGEG